TFDYEIPKELASEQLEGKRVLVGFGSHHRIGIIVGLTAKPFVANVKPIQKMLDGHPILSKKLLDLTRRVSDYYCNPWGEAIATALPIKIRNGEPVVIHEPTKKDNGTESQAQTVYVQAPTLTQRLVYYSQVIEKTVREGKSVIFLSPEIREGDSIYNLLKGRYGDSVTVMHRKQKAKEELTAWLQAREGRISILIGTRPAVFAPFVNLGLIIVDDEDGYGYKEEQMPYYHARDVALMRSTLEKFSLILGGKLPSLESLYAIRKKKYGFIDLNDNARVPKITIADISHRRISRNKAGLIISSVVEDKLQKALQAQKKIILFVNRKGFASIALCQKCGFVLSCEACSSRLIFHFDEKKLICHSCGKKKEPYALCPHCNSHYISYMGFGTEKVLSHFSLMFPQARIRSLDKNHPDSLENPDILIATEMLFHQEQNTHADIVVALDLDSALQIVNFRSNEKLYGLLYRLRAIAKDELILQTRMAEYYQRKELLTLDLEKLFTAELKERKLLNLPPYTHLAIITVRGKDAERAKTIAQRIFDIMRQPGKKMELFEPREATPFKLRGNFRFTILIKMKNPLAVSGFLKTRLKKIKSSGAFVSVDVDPQ
ncbi:MAG: primosomal protein N', partial [Omnitrophica WOR_2 bacterium GWA2_44_7]